MEDLLVYFGPSYGLLLDSGLLSSVLRKWRPWHRLQVVSITGFQNLHQGDARISLAIRQVSPSIARLE